MASRSRVRGNDTVTTPEDTNTKAIVILTDIFGLASNNNQLIADELAEKLDVDVYVPDMFDGAPPVPEAQMRPFMPDEPGVRISLWSKLQFLWILIRNIFSLRRALNKAKADATITEVLQHLSLERHYKKIGVLGYCFGGSVGVRCASTGLIDSIVIAHPSPITMDEVKAIKIPASWACAEEDSRFPKPFQVECEAEFAQRPNGQLYEFKSYKGTVHGFASRPNMGNPVIKQAFKDALDQAAQWFTKTL